MRHSLRIAACPFRKQVPFFFSCTALIPDWPFPFREIRDIMGNEATKFNKEELSKMAQGNEKGVFLSKAVTKLFAFNQESGQNMMLPDPMAVGCLAWPDMLQETKACYGEVCTDNDATYGQVILYQEGAVYEAMPEIGSYNLEIVTKIDTKLFKDYFMSVMTD